MYKAGKSKALWKKKKKNHDTQKSGKGTFKITQQKLIWVKPGTNQENLESQNKSSRWIL